MLRRLLLAAVFSCSACSTGTAVKPNSQALLEPSDVGSSAEWRSYGHGYFNQRYSRLDQINGRNVQQLAPVYVFHTGVLGAFETNPIVADGVMYLTTAYDGIFAIDARSGRLLWKRAPLTGTFRHCCGPVNRGVALAGDLVLIGQLQSTV
jgi:glucose dehydrogenase